jgi:hypothetical protein
MALSYFHPQHRKQPIPEESAISPQEPLDESAHQTRWTSAPIFDFTMIGKPYVEEAVPGLQQTRGMRRSTGL